MTRETTDGLFIDLGYFTPEEYLVYVAEAASSVSSNFSIVCDAEVIEAQVIISITASSSLDANADKIKEAELNISSTTTVNAIASKIVDSVISVEGAFNSTLTADAFKNHTAILDVFTNLESTASKTVDPGSLLEFFADLNSAADRLAGFDSALVSQADISATVVKNVDSAANLETIAALSCDAIIPNIVTADASLSSAFIVTAEAIEYQLRPNTYNRPINLIKSLSDSFVTSPVKYGSHSLKVVDAGGSSSETSPAFSINENENFVAESWIRIDDIDAIQIAVGTMLFSLGAAEDNIETASDPLNITRRAFSVGLSLVSNGNRTFVLRYRNGSAWTKVTTTQLQPASDTWFHLAVVRESNVLKLLYNGNVIFSTSHSQAWAIDSSFSRVNFRHNYNVDPNDNVYYDAFRFARGTATITGLSTEPVDTEQTVVLYNFNNTVEDGYVRNITFNAVANLSSSFTQSVSTTVINDANIDIAANSTVEALIGKIQQGASNFDAVASQLTAAAKIGDFFINADVQATLDITPDLFKEYSADFASAFTQDTVVVKITDVELAANSEFTIEIETSGFKTFDAALASEFAQTADATRIQPGQADLTSEFSQTTVAVTAIDAVADLVVETQQTVANDRIRDADSAFDAIATQLTAVGKIGEFFINADVTATLTASGNSTAGVFVDPFIVTTNLEIAEIRIRPAAAQVEANSNLTATGIFVTDTTASLNGEFSVNADAARTRDVISDFDAIATQMAVIGKILPYFAGLESEFTVAANVNVIAENTSAIESEFITEATATKIHPGSGAVTVIAELTATLNRVASGEADLTVNATLVADAVVKVFNLDQYRYTIPRENRSHSITKETRNHVIFKETRKYIIEGT